MAIDPKSVESDRVLMLDYGSQYTHLITRRIRFLDVFSFCLSRTSSLKTIADYKPRVVILSGGPHSVHTPGSPSFPDGFIEWAESNGVFVLGICYGLQTSFGVGFRTIVVHRSNKVSSSTWTRKNIIKNRSNKTYEAFEKLNDDYDPIITRVYPMIGKAFRAVLPCESHFKSVHACDFIRFESTQSHHLA
ncbi:hypothetical protein F8388_018225 [Cannabis sativa]|uniref:Glutamine amidotransferase domain-containing protein n=1 Tax=Cannabis sativa TaxID=3483 RepID=A0A7J6GAX2_CANSA|nr:hypothetical protein F8388_018225 [Cannabis sativa]